MTKARNRSSLARKACSGRVAEPRHLEVRLDAGQQLAGAERLDQVVVGAGLHALDPALLAGAGRQQDDRHARACVGVGAQRASRPKPSSRGIMTSVSTRSGGFARASPRAPPRRRRPPRPRSARASSRRDVLAHVGVVVGQQDARRAPRRSAGGLRDRRRWRRCRVGRRRVVGQPAQRLLDERRRARCAVEASVRAAPDAGPAAGGAAPSGIATVKRAALAELALDRDRAAVQPDQLLHQRQADAGALVGAAARALDAVEALEQLRQLVGRDAGAGVAAPSARRAPSASRSATAISPSKVNLKAFESRLRTIFSHISRST